MSAVPPCCETKKRDEMRLFLRQKASNFKAMLSPFCKSPENQDYLAKYDETQLEELVLLYLAPFYKTNTLQLAQDAIVSQLSIDDEEVKGKVLRYLTCFCECLM